jgi:16S rRNA G966 N2-methylase RsmD
VFLEKHFPTADVIRRNLRELAVEDRATVTACDTFLQIRRMRMEGRTFETAHSWVVFCSPPYAFYTEREADMLALIGDLLEMAPSESVFVVEADETFDFERLPQTDQWQIREYFPAVVGIYRKASVEGDPSLALPANAPDS